jgi:hypothetical protein
LHGEFTIRNRATGLGFLLGEGGGAHALSAASGFGFRSDFDPATGGVNPVLGFASGGTYASAFAELGDGLVSLGYSRNADSHTIVDPKFGPMPEFALPTYRAQASTIAISWPLLGVRLNAAYTHLAEADGLLGAQASGALAFNGGSDTDAATLGFVAALGAFDLSGSATMARTAASDFGGPLALDKGLAATAYEIAASTSTLFAAGDSLRLSLAQPLHVESGSLAWQSFEVVDRESGRLGLVRQDWDVSGNREYRAELLYSLPVLEGRGQVSAFGLADLNPPAMAASTVSLSLGARFQLGL